MLVVQLDSMDAHLALLDSLRGGEGSLPARRAAFRSARRDFKRIEGLLGYYSPPLIRALNSADAEERDDDQADGFRTLRGFQLLEDRLFGAHEAEAWTGASHEIAAMRLTARRFRTVIPSIAPTELVCLEIARLELARVTTLGISGFDAALSGDAIPESADAIDGLRALPCLGRGPGSVAQALGAAALYLRSDTDFDTFDRFTFVRTPANAAFVALASAAGSARRQAGLAGVPYRRTWPESVASVYDARRFDVSAYAPPERNSAGTPALAALGRDLFFEPALSGNGTRSCAFCHVPERAFTDGRARAAPLDGRTSTSLRNTPSLINAALQPAQFVDERRVTLEEQVGDVLASAPEMGSSADAAARRLRSMPAYRGRLSSGADVRVALASYIRTLTALNAPFDRALRGETELGEEARHGFNIFMGKGGCGTCHFAPLFGGTLPPDFVTSDAEVIGVPTSAVTHGAKIDPDPGRGAIDRRGGLAHSFRTPSVRNAALTAPYMHNGAFRTLEEVVDFYNRGGGQGVGARVPNQTLSAEPLHLTPEERRALIAFMQSLTDTARLTTRPPRRTATGTDSPSIH